jgi:hypothetical protein
VDWVLDYLTDPTTHSIYRLLGRWPMNLRWRGGGLRRKRSLALAIRGVHRGKLTCVERVGYDNSLRRD